MTPIKIGIRRYQLDDASGLYEAARESIADIYPWMKWCHPDYSIEDSRSWVPLTVADWEAGVAYDFVVYDCDTGRFLGAVGINQINRVHDFANLGYWIRSSAAGRGLAPQAVRLCARFGFEELKLQRIEIVAAVGNARSQRVAEKAAATREGVLRHRLNIDGTWHDAVMFSVLPGDLTQTTWG
jgi:ribosomal-protein-serine acetyltransferase